MADDLREDPELVVNIFLQHKSLEQMQDYLARGRRFTTFDVRQEKLASSCERTKGRSIRSDVASLIGWSEGLSGHWVRLCERSHTTGPAWYALYSTVSSAWATSIERATVPTR